MWIFTNKGFISAVEDRNDFENVVVRSRARGHLKKIFPLAEVVETEDADYRYRVFISKEEFRATISDYIQSELTYDNFKNSIKPEDDEYNDFCSATWEEGLRFQWRNTFRR